VGLGATALGAASSAGALGAAKAAGSVTLLALTKWAGIGAMGGVVVAAAAHGLSGPEQRAPAPVVSVAAAPARPAPVAALPAPAQKSEMLAPPLESVLVRRSVAPSAPGAEELEAPLAAEVAFVDRGRAAFQRGDLGGALAALAANEREFPAPRLLPEVLYLRMEASARGGHHAHAAELARRILRSFPQSPHAARARAVVQAP
jgi:hypothetical protein